MVSRVVCLFGIILIIAIGSSISVHADENFCSNITGDSNYTQMNICLKAYKTAISMNHNATKSIQANIDSYRQLVHNNEVIINQTQITNWKATWVNVAKSTYHNDFIDKKTIADYYHAQAQDILKLYHNYKKTSQYYDSVNFPDYHLS